MPDDEFDSLAIRTLAREASALDRARLDALMAQDPALRQKFEELKVASQALREFGALAQDSPPASAPLPSETLRRLEQAVTGRNNPGTADSAAAPAVAGVRRRPEPIAPAVQENSSGWLSRFPRISGVNKFVWAAAAAVVLAVVGWFAARQWDRGHGSSPAESETIAWLLADARGVVVTRSGRTLSLQPVTPLQRGDEVTLARGTEVRFLTPQGAVTESGPKKISADWFGASAPAGYVPSVYRALTEPLSRLLERGLFITRRNVDATIYSPARFTMSLMPLIHWKGEPDKTYDITITDELNPQTPPWRVTGVVPPVDFAAVADWKARPLARDGIYRLSLREVGNVGPLGVTEQNFATLKDADTTTATTPPQKIERAVKAVALSQTCYGDALAELLTLPPEWAGTELVLRLKLLAFGELTLWEEYGATAAQLRQTIVSPRSK